MEKVYDRYGFDREGYNKEGYDRMGYDRSGYDKEGYDRNGMNIHGINKLSGYDAEGYDANGYDRNGYDREGYNAEGYDSDGFNHEGYDKEGYDRNGYDEEGYNRAGYDCYDFDRNGMNLNGFDIYGMSEHGMNVLGIYSDGFDENGLSLDGFSRNLFDEDGYHIYTGFDLAGFDRAGYNINGVDHEGYDRDGYSVVTGYNRAGYDRAGFAANGYNEAGYDRNGYNYDGYDINGYDHNGYDKQGYDAEGYDRDGYSKSGVDKNGYDRNGVFVKIDKNNLDNDDLFEAAFFKKCEAQIKGYYAGQIRKEVMAEYVPIERKYTDRWGFVQTQIVEPDIKRAENEIKRKLNRVLDKPYFIHIDYSGNPELYIGEQKIHGWVTDWADEQAQKYYYHYQYYIGDKDTDLKLVREIHFENQKYSGYKDLYRKNEDNYIAAVADEHLQRILEANQKSKKVHTIVESIQQNQYNIIATDMDKSIVVLGCAGSGKTMILMHKIRYMKYNYEKYYYKKLDMHDVMVISPTNILAKESRHLSKILQVDQVQQFTSVQLYHMLINTLLDNMDVPYEKFTVVDEGNIDTEYYNVAHLKKIALVVHQDLGRTNEAKKYINQNDLQNNQLLKQHIDSIGIDKKDVNKIYQLYLDNVKELQRAGVQDIENVIKRIQSYNREWQFYEDLIDFILDLVNSNVFKEETNNKNYDEEEIKTLFFETKEILKNLDFMAFHHDYWLKADCVKNPITAIQMIQMYLDDKKDVAGVHKILNEWKYITLQKANDYLDFIRKKISGFERLERKKIILQNMLNNGYFAERLMSNKQIKFNKSFEKLVDLYDKMEPVLVDNDLTPLRYFEIYDKIIRRKHRLLSQKKDPSKKSYMYDAILSELGIDYSVDKDIEIPMSKAFAMTYILFYFSDSITTDKKYIFIDEFQDFSKEEIRLFKNLYPTSVFNLYGDIGQCINEKGIDSEKEIPTELFDKELMSINENYRNARQITDFVNDELHMKMLPVGLNGILKKVHIIPNLKMESDDRVAIIVKDISEKIKVKLQRFVVNYFDSNAEIQRGVYNVLTIAQAKGLEFEKVVVVKENMTRNEFYVACTRAIQELYVL